VRTGKPYTNTPSEPDECEKHETPYLFKCAPRLALARARHASLHNEGVCSSIRPWRGKWRMERGNGAASRRIAPPYIPRDANMHTLSSNSPPLPPPHPVGYCASSCLGCSPEHSNCTSSEDQKTYGLLTLRIGTVNQPLVYATVGGTVSKSGGGGARADRGVSSVSSPGPAVNRSGDDARWLASGTGPAGTALFKARYRPVDCV